MRWLVATWMCLAAFPAAEAQEVLDFTSAPVNQSAPDVAGGYNFPNAPIGSDITGTIDLPAVLPASGTITYTQIPFSFQIAGTPALSSAMQAPFLGFVTDGFTFTTSDGRITGYSFFSTWNNGSGPGGVHASIDGSSGAPTTYQVGYAYPPDSLFDTSASATGGATWVAARSTQVPEVDAEGAGAAITMLLSMLLIAGGARYPRLRE